MATSKVKKKQLLEIMHSAYIDILYPYMFLKRHTDTVSLTGH